MLIYQPKEISMEGATQLVSNELRDGIMECLDVSDSSDKNTRRNGDWSAHDSADESIQRLRTFVVKILWI